MSGAALETILSSPTTRGAFRLNSDGFETLKASPPEIEPLAQATRDLWACIGSLMAEPDLMVAKREGDLSVATAKGGLLLETSGPVNLGILRATMQSDEVVRPDFHEEVPTDAPAGISALWSLARWIELIEARRALVVTAGDAVFKLWAEKGCFGTSGDSTASDVTEAILAAADAEAPVTLEYAAWGDDAPQTCDTSPIALLAPAPEDDSDWLVFNDAMPVAAPPDASLDVAADATELSMRLTKWGAGRPFEVAVLNATAQRIVVAEAETPDRVRINASALQREPKSEKLQLREGSHVA